MFPGCPGRLPRRPADSDGGIGTIPLDLFLLAIGGQAGQELAARLGL